MAKYPDSTKTSLEQRLAARARERWPQIATLRIRHRGAFSYIDATLTDATTLKLCRLRYVGSAHHWQFAIYRASHDDYDESLFPTGLPIGTCQDALDTACGLYLNDPTAWTGPPANLRAGPLSPSPADSNKISHTWLMARVQPPWAPPLVELSVGVTGHLLCWEKVEADGSWWAWVSWVHESGGRVHHKVVQVRADTLRPLEPPGAYKDVPRRVRGLDGQIRDAG